MSTSYFIQHPGKVIETGKKFSHVMAIALDPVSHYTRGVLRCITSRKGDVAVSGYIDRSELHHITGASLDSFTIGERVAIRNEEDIVGRLKGKRSEFLGLEDPDIFVDHTTGFVHLYFTMPFLRKNIWGRNITTDVYLGHAVGKNLDSLEMTMPVLLGDTGSKAGAKEVSIAPVNSQGLRYNLIESSIEEKDFTYSTVRVAIAGDMGKPWRYGETIFHPKHKAIPWIGGHASPGPLLPKSFMDMGEGKMLGILNGREVNKKSGKHITYGHFSVGLFIYDYEKGKIEWTSSNYLIRDTEAKTITFASQFVETKAGEGILYAHVDDSFVRAYTLKAEELQKLLPR